MPSTLLTKVYIWVQKSILALCGLNCVGFLFMSKQFKASNFEASKASKFEVFAMKICIFPEFYRQIIRGRF